MPDGAYTNSSIKLNMASLSYGPAFFDKEPQAQFTPWWSIYFKFHKIKYLVDKERDGLVLCNLEKSIGILVLHRLFKSKQYYKI